MPRREFRRKVRLNALGKFLLPAILSIAIASWSAGQVTRYQDIDNGLLKISFDTSTRTYSLFEIVSGDWVTVVHNAELELTFKGGAAASWTPRAGAVTVKTDRVEDAVGKGKSMNVRVDAPGAAWSVTFIVYDGLKAGSVQVSVRNLSGKEARPAELRSMLLHDAGSVQFATNHVLLHHAGRESGGVAEVVKLDSIQRRGGYGPILFAEPEAYRSFLLEFLTDTAGINRFAIGLWNPAVSSVELSAISDLSPLRLKAGATVQGDRLLFSVAGSPIDHLEQGISWVEGSAPVVNKPLTPAGKEGERLAGRKEIPTFWTSGAAYGSGVTEENILQELTSVRALRPAGLKYIQIDEGYQRGAGDWELNSRFSHDHRWLTKKIHDKGMLASLWIAPFAVSARSEFVREHPDWLIKDDRDSAIVVMTKEEWGGAIYAVDPTIPSVQSWIENLAYTATSYWGYDALKLDLLSIVAAGAGFHDGRSAAHAYRMGLEAIRRGTGSDRLLFAAGALPAASIGIVDGLSTGPRGLADPATLASSAASRWFYNNHAWYNDPGIGSTLSGDRGRMRAGVAALSGQVNTIGDRLTELSPEERGLLSMTLPVFGQSGRPVDYFSDPASKGLEIVPQDGGAVLTLDRRWKFNRADSVAWKDPDLDDSRWEEREVPGAPERIESPDTDGIVWYRTSFTVPAGTALQPMTLHLGRISDCDRTYLNGVLVGETGSFPPDVRPSPYTYRMYALPDSLLRRDGQNTIAVRVYSRDGRGGFSSVEESHTPSLWILPVEKKFETWWVAGLFNWSKDTIRITLSPERLRLPPRKQYMLYERWTDRFLGPMGRGATVPVPPRTSRIVSIHEQSTHPVVCYTSRHLASGAIDLVSEVWDDATNALSIVSDRLIDEEYDVVIAVPPGMKFRGISAPCRRESRFSQDGIVHAILHPSGQSRISWKVLFNRE